MIWLVARMPSHPPLVVLLALAAKLEYETRWDGVVNVSVRALP